MTTLIQSIYEKIKNNEKITYSEYCLIIQDKYERSQSKTYDDWVKSEV